MGSSTAHLLSNRDELLGTVGGRGRCCFLPAGVESEEVVYGCRLPTIATTNNYIHHNMLQHLTLLLYKAGVWVAYPCQPLNEDILADRNKKKVSKVFHLHSCSISVRLKVIMLCGHVLRSCG